MKEGNIILSFTIHRHLHLHRVLATFCLWSCWPLALFFLILYFTLSLSLGLAWAASTLTARTAITNLSMLLVAGHWRMQEVSWPVVVLQ